MIEAKAKRIGVLLAGGASKRMRQDKLKMLFEGQTLLDRGCQLLSALVANGLLDEFVVSGSIHRANTRIVNDQFLGQGPAGGILSTIKTLGLIEGDLVIALPVDMPLLDIKHLSKLIEASCTNAQSFCYHNAWLPISIVITADLLHAIEKQRNDQKGLSVKQILTLGKGSVLEPESATQLINVNTPEQWHQLSIIQVTE